MCGTMPYEGARDPMEILLEEGGPLRGNALQAVIDDLVETGRDAEAERFRARYADELA